MADSLSLQRSLYRRQQKQISDLVQGSSKAFLTYEATYRRATRTFRRQIDLASLDRRIRDSDLVFVGDYHTLRAAQECYLDVVTRRLEEGRRVVLALEFVEGRHQKHLDAFLNGKLRSHSFLERIGHPYRGGYDIWPAFERILSLAKARCLDVIAIDRRATGPHALADRDVYAAKRIASASRASDNPMVLVLMGQFHVTPAHLPRQVERVLGPVRRRSLTLYQNAEDIWWKLAKAGLTESVAAVEISDEEVCLFSASPVVCQRSFLDYVEAESGDAPIEEPSVTHTVRHLARDIGRLLGIPVASALKGIEVVTSRELQIIERISRRARFSPKELAHLKRHVLSRDSAFIPRARVVWLASLSLNHAAEEAAHLVRFAAVGHAMERPRPTEEAFWARCLEEMFGFFGSRLLNPARRCVDLDEWSEVFLSGPEEKRAVAAFVLALSAAVSLGVDETQKLLPLSSWALFNGVSHALGARLGDGLAKAHAAGALKRAEVQQLFRDRLDAPFETYRALVQRFLPKAKQPDAGLAA